MPELPEVEYYRKKSRKVLNKKIKDLKVYYRNMVKTPLPLLKKHLVKHRLRSSYRHGKYLFFETDSKKYLLLHFGMTGDVHYWNKEKPPYAAMDIELANGYSFTVTSRRKFGRIELVDDMQKALKDKGEDALSIDKRAFENIISRSSGRIKLVLMDQKRIAGIGNIYSDEILYQARIHPMRKANTLSTSELSRLYQQVRDVLTTAVDADANAQRLPRGYLIPQRKNEGKIDGRKVEMMEIDGRSAYFCPSVQNEVKKRN